MPASRKAMDANWMRTLFHPYVFVPDMSPDTPGGVADAQGVYPTAQGLRVRNSLSVRIVGIPPSQSPTLGWFNAVFPSGEGFVYVGTAQHLYENVGAQFQENDSGQTFTNTDNPWTFTQVGNYVIAADGVDPVQAVVGPGNQFAPLGGSPPIAFIASSADPGGTGYFAFLFNLQSDPQGWACSGAGQPNSWPLDTTNLSAKGTLGLTQGPVTAATPLRGGVCAFKGNSLYYGQFVGTPYVWQFSLVSPSQGVQGPYAVASASDAVYFIGNDNIYSFDGWNLQPIPNALAQWLFSQSLDFNHADKIIGTYDQTLDLVTFYYPSQGSNGVLDTALSWHRKSGRWCIDHITITGALQTNLPASTGTTYGQVTTTYPTYGAITPGTTYGMLASASSLITVGGIFLADNNLYTYSGLPRQLDTFFVTNNIGSGEKLTSIYRARLSCSIYALMNNYNLFGEVKDLDGNIYPPNSPSQVVTHVSVGPRGFFDFRQTGRWHNFGFFINNATEVTGYELLVADGGWR